MSWAIWITGLPGSGKSVLARAAADRLRAGGERVVVLELDEIRKGLTPSPTYSETERDTVYRALVFLATTLTDAGIPVIIDATGHRRAWRDLARVSIPFFAEVQLECPLPVCRQREEQRRSGNAPRGIYARAGQPGATVPGVDVPYEPAILPELVLHTAVESVSEATAKIVALARTLAPSVPTAPNGSGWVIWITGLPGSGKTTLAQRVADALGRRCVSVRVLDFDDLRAVVAPRSHMAPLEQEIAHRTLIYAARLLSDAGIGVIIDATAPQRAWRALARKLIEPFAEVQLRCPRGICLERERAVRWRRPSCAHGQPERVAVIETIDLVFDYEPALAPELTIDTEMRDVWTATEEIARLAERLLRAAVAAHTLRGERRCECERS